MTESRSLTDKFMLRLPDGMRDRIKAAADANNRSMNAEIVATLEDKYPSGLDADFIKGVLMTLVESGSLTEENVAAIMRNVSTGQKYQIELDVDDSGTPLGPMRIGELSNPE